MIPRRRVILLVGFLAGCVLAGFASFAQGASGATSATAASKCAATARKASTDPFAHVRALLQTASANGWTITAAGQQVLGGASPVAAGQAHGTAALSAGGADQLTAEILATTNQAGATLPSDSQPDRTTQSARRALDTTSVFVGCNYGQSGMVTYEVGYGWTHVDWNQQSIASAKRKLAGPAAFCNFMQCVVGDEDTNVAIGWKITFADEVAEFSKPIPLTATCGF